MSVSSGGAEPNQNSSDSAISADGRFVAFRSGASNLVREDGNDAWDIFVRDLKSGRISRASVSSTGAEANGSSGLPAISADGRFVAFVAEASNLVSGDQNNTDDVFVRDLKTRGTRRVSISSSGAEGNGRSLGPQISADGRFVAFLSRASNLVSGDRNGVLDVFVRDLKTRRTTRVSVSSSGGEGNGPSASAVPAISADGRLVAFDSEASNLVSGDRNNAEDVFVRDLKTRRTTRVSVSSRGREANHESIVPAISADGRFVAFGSEASNLVSGDRNNTSDGFVRDLTTRRTTRVSVSSRGAEANDYSTAPAISADGRFVAFRSEASNLVSGDRNDAGDIFWRDLKTRRTTRVSVSPRGREGNDESFLPRISADGRFVAFSSQASNLVSGDRNGFHDVFRRGPLR